MQFRFHILLRGVPETKRFLDGGGRKGVLPHLQVNVLVRESEHLHFGLRVCSFGVLGGQSEGGVFELLGFVLELVEQFYLAVPDAHRWRAHGTPAFF